MNDLKSLESAASYPGRWRLLADAITFQIKLAIDGLRDLVLIPVSALGALLSLLGVRDSPLEFYNIVRLGRRTERAINLFGAATRDQPPAQEPAAVDRLAQRVEQAIAEQYERGGMTRSAKDAIDQIIDKLSPAQKNTPD